MKNHILLALVIGMFTEGCNSFMIGGLLPQIGQTIGQPIAVTGQGITAFSLAYVLSAPLYSIIFSNKSLKLSIQIAVFVFLLGNFITLISKTIVVFLIGMSLAGIGIGFFIPLCITIAVHLSDVSVRGRILSLVWGSNSAGVVLGVPFGLYLSTFLNWQWSIAYMIILGLLVFMGFSFQNIDIKLPVLPSFRDPLCLLVDPRIMLVIGISCFISIACLGLYSYIAPIQSGAPHSLAMTLFAWGLGGFIGSTYVGILTDLTKKPLMIMVLIITGLIITFISLPFTKNLPYLGLIPFFIWGALGWAIMTPQQHILSELQENQGTILAAINTSAIGLGSVFGTAIGGTIIASGFAAIDLPFLAAILLLGTLMAQLTLMKNFRKECTT